VLAVTSLITDKTTHIKTGAEPAANITATSNDPGATWTWSSTGDPVTGTGNAVTWKPAAGAAVGSVTITATAHSGAQLASKTIVMHVTSLTIKTTYGNPLEGGNIATSGHFIDFTRPMVNEGTKKMSDFIDGSHVVLYNLWEIWCPPCRDEMDMMYEWAQDYKDYNYYHVGHCSTYAITTGTPNVKAWLETPGYSPAPPQDTRPWTSNFHIFVQSDSGTGQQWAGDMPLWGQYWTGYLNPNASLPRTQLYDMDGNCRYWSSTIPDSDETMWRGMIKELTGAP